MVLQDILSYLDQMSSGFVQNLSCYISLNLFTLCLCIIYGNVSTIMANMPIKLNCVK